jgi:hypothetical protein
VLTYFEFEEVECVGESLTSCKQVDFYSQQKRSSDGVETRCFEVSLSVMFSCCQLRARAAAFTRSAAHGLFQPSMRQRSGPYAACSRCCKTAISTSPRTPACKRASAVSVVARQTPLSSLIALVPSLLAHVIAQSLAMC